MLACFLGTYVFTALQDRSLEAVRRILSRLNESRHFITTCSRGPLLLLIISPSRPFRLVLRLFQKDTISVSHHDTTSYYQAMRGSLYSSYMEGERL